MTRSLAATLAALLIALPAGRADSAELKAGRVTLVVRKDGCGFVDSIRFGGREVVRAANGFAAGVVVPAPAGDGTIESLFPHRAAGALASAVDSVRVEADAMAVRGSYTDGKLRVPFVRRIRLSARDGAVHVSEEADFTRLGARWLVARHELRLPLVVCKDPHERMFGFGAPGRAELFRMDMNDINRGGKQLISAPRGHRPYWDLGGVLQHARGACRIWKANHADTLAYPLAEGRGAPGWADYSEPDWGMTAVVDDANEAAPWAITIDARKGVFAVAPHPASETPVAGTDYGRRRFAFRLLLHETSWPATYPCELPLDLYKALLEDLATGSRGKSPWVLYRPTGTADIDTIVHRERIQPSIMLRTLYRGDAWQMQHRMRGIGVQTPRNQPMAEWEKAARRYLEHIRAHGVPKRDGG